MALALIQGPYPGVNPKEVATVVVGGIYYSDWETVWVQHRWHDPFNYFRFTAAERDPVPALWDRIQFKPGDTADIYLGGVLGMRGIILVRQVAYEANSHGVSLQGKGNAWELTGHILPHEGDGHGNFKGNLISIAEQVLSPTHVRIGDIIGNIPGMPLNPPDGVHFQQGETRWQFLERLSRDRNVDLSNNKDGNLVLVGSHGPRMNAVLIEGENIFSAQVVINGEDYYSFAFVSGQKSPSDQSNGPAASEMHATATPPSKQLPEYRPLYVPIEHPVATQAEVDLRALKEARWIGLRIDADIVVYGWFDPTGKLWQVGTEVTIDSSMIPMGEGLSDVNTLTIETATFTQDSQSGTRTSLHLIEPWRNNTSGGPATLPPTTTMPTIPTGTPSPPPRPTLEE